MYRPSSSPSEGPPDLTEWTTLSVAFTHLYQG